MFLVHQASMHWQIETADFNLSSENNRIIMSDGESEKFEHFLEIKAKEWINDCNNV